MNDNVATPNWLMRYFEDYFDPCPLNPEPEVDGLKIEWKDKTYCNMPYSKPMEWCRKAVEEANKGKKIVLLTRVDPSTKWWLVLVAGGFRPLFFHGRIRFTGKTPNFASALWFYEGGK